MALAFDINIVGIEASKEWFPLAKSQKPLFKASADPLIALAAFDGRGAPTSKRRQSAGCVGRSRQSRHTIQFESGRSCWPRPR